MMRKPDTEGGKKLRTGAIGRFVLNPYSRVVHGNAAGYANNAVAQRELRAFQARSGGTLPAIQADPRIDFLSREGYTLVDAGYDADLLRTLTKRARSLLESDTESKAAGRYDLKPSRFVERPLQKIPEVRELLTPAVANIVRGYYGSHFEVEMVRVWRNYPVPEAQAGADHYSNLWHNDYDLITRLRYFVYLTDGVTRDTGALRFHAQARTRQILRAGYVRRDLMSARARRLLEDPASILYFEGGVGAAAFMNPQVCLHRAGVPRVGSHRDIVQFTFVPGDQPLAPDWPERIRDDPEIGKA